MQFMLKETLFRDAVWVILCVRWTLCIIYAAFTAFYAQDGHEGGVKIRICEVQTFKERNSTTSIKKN